MRPTLEELMPQVSQHFTVAEWWVHQRAGDQWHGHPLHFDTNEQLLRDSFGTSVEHPAVSSVVYLCQDTPRFGPTLVTDQRHGGATLGGGSGALVRPRMGRQLFFDGGYLHGVMPGKPWMEEPHHPGRRLTLMVGWWTTPIPTSPATDPPRPLMEGGGRWHRELGGAGVAASAAAYAVEAVKIPSTSPIWTDVPGSVSSDIMVDPPYGRFFLRSRQQIDEDLFN
ncbi:unnamed protein product [Durusdinium trenchii]|uniref:Fe2OG dioxygenase domain-containing protein n=1 Tax=Durusdinium trenchii TaxID=1381693 RepID=A0ABP0L462_9DINO